MPPIPPSAPLRSAQPLRARLALAWPCALVLVFLSACAVDATPPADVPSPGAGSEPQPPRVAERPEVQREDHDHGLVVEDAAAWRSALAAGGVVQDSGEPFTQVSYLLDGADLFELEYRLRDAQGELTGWQPLELTWHEEEAGVGRIFLDEPAMAFEVRGPEGAVSFGTFQFHAEHVSDPDVLTRNLPMEVEDKDKSASLPPWVLTRAQWGARNPGRLCGSAHTPRRMTIHHTVTPNNDSLSPAARMRQIQAFHIDGNGWCDVGYHFMVGIDGRVYEGRNNWLRTGAHVAVANRDNVGINLVGNFMNFEPRQVQIDGAGRIVGWLANRHNITLNRTNLRGHQEFMATACPGTRLQARLGEIIDRARGDQTPAPPAPPTPPAPTDPVEPPPGTTNLIGFVREGSIQAEDRPIAGATVTTDDGRTTTTNANGFYRFNEVPLRTYRVTATASGYLPASVSRVVDRTGTDYYASIALQPGTQTATLTGFVREDSIDNDTRPVAGATVTLDGGRTTTTNANGVYRLEDVELGTRTVSVDAPGYLTGTATRIVDQAGTLFYASVALEREPLPTPPGLDVPIDQLDRMEVRWERLGDGSWKFQAVAPAAVREVAYHVDGHLIRSSTDRAADFDARYRFDIEGIGRSLEAVGFDADGNPVTWAMGVLDVTDTVGVFVRQIGASEFEIGLERAPWAARFLEVIVDGFPLTDSVTGTTRSDRQAVRYRFQHLGERQLVLNTFNLDGSYRGTIRRTVTLQ